MKHPWQYWTLYAACLAIALPAMGWLSLQALRLDREQMASAHQTELARREAELQELVSSSLWRMDGLLTPLIAGEAARPYYLYESFYRAPEASPDGNANDSESPQQTSDETVIGHPSPLLFQPSEFVVLHFQIGPGNKITSPQRPVGLECQQAMTCCGVTQAAVDANEARLTEIRDVIDFETLWAKCPEAWLPSANSQTMLSPAEWQRQVADTAPAQNIYQVDPKIQSMQKALQQAGIPPDPDFESAAQVDAVPSPPQGKQQAQLSRSLQRGNEDFNKRLESVDKHANQEWMGNKLNFSGVEEIVTPDAFVNEGIMRPLWIEGRLILARRVQNRQETVVQCCWLDWERIQDTLRKEVSDLLPHVAFEPFTEATEVRLGQALATLPVQLDINRDALAASLLLGPAGGLAARSGIGMALVIAWCCLGLTAVAGAFLLHGLIQLSERRGTFVSAVTHELRTPLTTFRMYAEMLAERMVASPEKQQKYAETMRVEADRLSHLVENVLQFARLERTSGQSRREETDWSRLLERFEDRLEERCRQADMQLAIVISNEDLARSFKSDPAAIEQILFNLVDNACKYARNARDNRVEVAVRHNTDHWRVTVRDFGPGVSSEVRGRMFRPFAKSAQQAADSAQGVGLGLALCRRMARSLGGRLTAASVSHGTEMVLTYPA